MPKGVYKRRARRSLEDRFWSKVSRGDVNDCWLWNGATDSANADSYGRIKLDFPDRRIERAHRVSYEMHRGPIPDGLSVLHRCDVRRCVNPAHLFLGTDADNVADMLEKGRGRIDWRGEQTHCKRGHEFTPENTRVYRGRRNCRKCATLHTMARRKGIHVDGLHTDPRDGR